MTHFTGPWQKLTRAKEQLASLEWEMTPRPNNDLYRSMSEFDSKQRRQVMTTRLAQDALVRWGVISGEIVHDLHSALDQAVCDLIRLTDPSSECDESAFPIYDSPLAAGKGERRELRAVKVTGAAAVIEAEQPYGEGSDDPHEHPLWLLRSLSNWDKHRMIQAARVSIAVPMREGPAGSRGPSVEWQFGDPVTLEDQTTVEQVTVTYPEDMNMQVQASLAVTFQRPGPAAGRSVISTLYRIERRVEDVLRKLDAVVDAALAQ